LSAASLTRRLDDDAAPVRFCPHCDADLEVHQPDEDLPDRLLAVCPCCKAWFLTDPSGDLTCLVPSDDEW
jgi:hypothetical protein